MFPVKHTTLNAISDKQRGIVHTLEQIGEAERSLVPSERERQMQRLCDKCDEYKKWLRERDLEHDFLEPHPDLAWHTVVSVLCDPPGGAREQWLDAARAEYEHVKVEQGHLETIRDLATIDPSWLNESEQEAVDSYMATLGMAERVQLESRRQDAILKSQAADGDH